MGELTELFRAMIPIWVLSIPIVAIWTRHRRKIAEMKFGSNATQITEVEAQSAAKMQTLEQRVRVLERIVTDGGYNVAAQIEALRDTSSVAGSGVPLGLTNKEPA